MTEESQIQLLTRLGTICKHHREISKLTGADFNVFKILKVAEDEVRHSAFLAELLDPNGTHGQGETFLKLFVDDSLNIKDFNFKTATVEVEKPIGGVSETTGGRIDIFIDDQNGNHIIIENKIYADDQENQLIRYYNYSKERGCNLNLLYLNMKEEDAKEKSIKNESKGIILKSGEHYRQIFYKSEILTWLIKCHKESVSMPLLREGIAHYINLIKYLTGESTNKAMSKDIIDLLTENPTTLQNANELANNWLKTKAKVQWTFWETLKVALINRGIELEDLPETVSEPKILECYRKNFSENSTRFGLYCPVYKKNDVVIRWACIVNQNIHFGFKIWRNGKPANDAPENALYKNIVIGNDINYEQNPTRWLSGYQYPNPKLNFYEFNTEAIYNLADKNKLDQTVRVIAEKAYRDIVSVKEKLSQL